MMKKFIITCFAVILFASGFLGHTMLTSMAKEESAAYDRYYKSIQIQEGDSLWQIAGEYCQDGPMTKDEYIKALRQMNNLKKDTIHKGQYLTVVYFVAR